MRQDILASKEDILQYISENRSKAYICKVFDCRPQTLDSCLTKLKIEYKGNQGAKGHKICKNKKSALEYIQKEQEHIKSSTLRKKLIEDGIKKHKCEQCELVEWLEKPIPLELHHIDGNRFNFELVNLQLLCPNCHSLTENYGSKNKKVRKISKKIIEKTKINKEKKCECGNVIKRKSKNCIECSKKKQRKVKRPEYELLIKQVSELGYSGTGRLYGVSNVSIKKWVKIYEKTIYPIGEMQTHHL